MSIIEKNWWVIELDEDAKDNIVLDFSNRRTELIAEVEVIEFGDLPNI